MKQIEVAKKYLGQKEKPGNDFDLDTPLGRMLKEAGHKDGEAWCVYAMEGIFCEASPAQNEELRALFSASAVQTYHNFKEAGYDAHDFPRAGDLVIWQRYKDGKPTWQGHAGLVVKVDSTGAFYTYEGNTNSAGSREGTVFTEKLRKRIKTDNGLNILGFITVSI